MVRRMLCGLMVVGVMMTSAAITLGQTAADGTPFESTLGLSLPSFGRVHYSEEGVLNKLTGFNLGLGYSVRYYNRGFEVEAFNLYWGWGTVLLLIPYVEFGLSYPLPIGEKGNLLVLDLGVVYIAPRLGISILY